MSMVDQERVELVSAGRREFRNIKDGLTHYFLAVVGTKSICCAKVNLIFLFCMMHLVLVK